MKFISLKAEFHFSLFNAWNESDHTLIVMHVFVFGESTSNVIVHAAREFFHSIVLQSSLDSLVYVRIEESPDSEVD